MSDWLAWLILLAGLFVFSYAVVANSTVIPLDAASQAQLPKCPVCPCGMSGAHGMGCKVPLPQVGACIGQVEICATPTATPKP